VQEKAGYLDSIDGVNFKGCVKRAVGDVRKRIISHPGGVKILKSFCSCDLTWEAEKLHPFLFLLLFFTFCYCIM